MKKTALTARACTIGMGTALLLGAAGMASADTPHGDSDVDVDVEITPIEEPGVLAMSVDTGSTTLTEDGSTLTERQFTGELPTVTVTDTRVPEDIGEKVGWYVLGTVSDFTGDADQPAIDAGHLGWAPQLIDGGDLGLVSEGDVVDTVMDGEDSEAPTGLVDQELLAMAWDSAEIAPEGQWTAGADLFLRTPASVAPGSYSATLTLSLFE